MSNMQTPQSDPYVAAEHQCGWFARTLGKVILFISGWHVSGRPPEGPKMLIIAAPHTSNWDLPLMLAAAYHFRLRVRWLGKHTLFKLPVLGSLLRLVGGIPVDRTAPQDLVKRLADQIRAEESFVLVVPPSGTRSRREYWKSGFYRISQAAGIPLVCGYLDYPKREAGLGLILDASGDLSADMDRIRAFYAPIGPRHPEKATRMRLRAEDD